MLMNKRQEKKLNKNAMKILIKHNIFCEDDFGFDDRGMMEIWIHEQTENCDEYDTCSAYDYVYNKAWHQTITYDYDPLIDHVRERQLFKIRNVKHVYQLFNIWNKG